MFSQVSVSHSVHEGDGICAPISFPGGGYGQGDGVGMARAMGWLFPVEFVCLGVGTMSTPPTQERDPEIQSVSWWYASYWNAFLFWIVAFRNT